MSKQIDIEDLNIFYGDFRAVEGVSMTIEPKSVTAFIGPSGCGKSTVLRTLNRMHDVIPGAGGEGSVKMDDKDIYGARVDSVNVRYEVGMVLQEANPFTTMSSQNNMLAGVRLNKKKLSKSEAEELTENALRGANLWEEVKVRLDNPGSGL